MRIIINVEEAKDAKGKKTVRVRTGYTFNAADCLRIQNCGVEIYKIIVDGFGRGFEGGVMVHEGEWK